MEVAFVVVNKYSPRTYLIHKIYPENYETSQMKRFNYTTC